MGARAGRRRVCVGRIAGVHGVRGWVRLASYTAEPAAIGTYGPLTDEADGRTFRVTVKHMAKGYAIAAIDGVADRTTAEALVGMQLFADRDALPAAGEDEFYRADLIGLDAVLPDGAPFGRIVAVEDFGAGDVLEVRPAQGASVMVPFTSRVVPLVDVAAGRVVIDPPPGLLGPSGTDTELDADAADEDASDGQGGRG